MDEKVCQAAYRLARSFTEWKDMAGDVKSPMETQDAWHRLSMAEELFRRHLDGDDGRPCDDCPEPPSGEHIPNDIRTFTPSEDT